MNDFYEYLMLEMAADINSQWDHEYHRAHELCFLLSLDSHPVPETFFDFYASNIACERSVIDNALAFFSGLGLLTVHCDCSPENKLMCDIHIIEESPFFLRGKESLANNSNLCQNLNQRIASIRAEFDD